MISTIDKQLNNLVLAVNWVKTNLKGERQQAAYDSLVKKRIQLNKIKTALQENPAAVLYGESQQGKSYLVSSLLSTEGTAFKVIDSDNNREYDFITKINPIGQGAESTSVVTRFSVRPVSVVPGYPVKVKLLSLSDIVLILCDTYYSDIKDYIRPLKEADIRSTVQQLRDRISGSTARQTLVGEDDVLIMQEYFNRHFHSKAPYIFDADYFRTTSQFIESATVNDLSDIFAVLWNNNLQLTELFNNILQQYQHIQFATELYVPYDAILRDGAAILDVKRLHELYDMGSERTVSAVSLDNGIQNSHTVSASYLCALTAEVILQLPQALVNEKAFLQSSDVLDFPGARARLDKREEDIVDSTLMPQMLLRGKVAYLFNKYSDNLMINTLLFCHGKKQAGPRFMPDLLKNWIESFVGIDAGARQLFMHKAQISPLFVIGTMFNLDLQKDQNDVCGDTKSLTARWQQRFETVYHKELFGEDCKWLDQWTPQEPFKNFYFLRDFYYSSEEQNNIFRGWTRDGGKEVEEIVPDRFPDFRAKLKESFLQHPFVQKHFANPEEAWTEAASINKDGAGYIIRNLTVAAQNINSAREDKFQRDLADISAAIVAELSKYYHDENSDNNMLQAKRLAGETQAALDIAFGRDPYFFGQMMQHLILKEGDVYRIFHEEFQKTNLAQQKDLGKYVYIRMKAQGLSPANTFETNLDILSRAYEMTADDCKRYFESRDIDLQELFSDSDNGMKNISWTLAEQLEEYWFGTWLRQDNFNTLTQFLDETTLANIIDMLHALYVKLGLTKYVAQSIRQYVDKFGANVDEIQEMIADMCAEILNKFVSNVGFTYLAEDAVQSLKEANEKQQLGLNFFFDDHTDLHITPDNIAEIFDAMDDLDAIKNNLGNRLQYVPGFNSRKRWSELLKIGFIQTQDIPNYDVVANKQLGEIKTKFETLNQ